MEETWKDAPGWESRYQVSNLGRVRSKDSVRGGQRGRIMKPTVSSRGHYKVRLTDGPRREQGQVHRMVCQAFYGAPPKDKPLALHRNGNALDNRVENLYWGDAFDNMRDAVRHGVHLNARKTHCPQGHEYTEENLVKSAKSRTCKTCSREQQRQARMDRLAAGLPEGHPDHGTVRGYSYYECRCSECRIAGSEDRAKRPLRTLPPNDERHGTVNGYVNWGCRCDPCRAAESLRSKSRGKRPRK